MRKDYGALRYECDGCWVDKRIEDSADTPWECPACGELLCGKCCDSHKCDDHALGQRYGRE